MPGFSTNKTSEGFLQTVIMLKIVELYVLPYTRHYYRLKTEGKNCLHNCQAWGFWLNTLDSTNATNFVDIFQVCISPDHVVTYETRGRHEGDLFREVAHLFEVWIGLFHNLILSIWEKYGLQTKRSGKILLNVHKLAMTTNKLSN